MIVTISVGSERAGKQCYEKAELPVSAHGNAWLTCRQLRFARGFIACPRCQKACLSRERSSMEVMVLMSSKADFWANDSSSRSRSIHKYN